MNETTNLRQSDAIAKITGILSEKNLEEGLDKNGKEIVKGTMSIKTDELNTVNLRVYVARFNNDGSENRAWAGIHTVMNDYKSIADVGFEQATIVNCNGQYAPSTYMGNDRQLHEGVPQYRGSFFSSLTHEKMNNGTGYRAEVEVEIFVRSVRPEMKNVDGDVTETGRLILDGWMNTYNGLEKTSFIVPEDMSEVFADIVQPGDTRKIFAKIVNTAETKKIEIPVALGKPQIKIQTIYKHELIVESVSENYADSDDPTLPAKAFDPDVIREAIHVYEEKLESLKVQSENSEVKKATPSKGNLPW